jgi:hypothetical protein
MIVEERIYSIVAGQIAAYLSAYAEEGYNVQRFHLGDPIGYYSTEFGTLNQVVHLWQYVSFDDRAKRRASLMADPVWLAFLPKVAPLIKQMENKLLTPTQFRSL